MKSLPSYCVFLPLSLLSDPVSNVLIFYTGFEIECTTYKIYAGNYLKIQAS